MQRMQTCIQKEKILSLCKSNKLFPVKLIFDSTLYDTAASVTIYGQFILVRETTVLILLSRDFFPHRDEAPLVEGSKAGRGFVRVVPKCKKSYLLI